MRAGTDFSGVGSFEQALERLGVKHEVVFSCDMDKYARQTYELYFGKPKYYPKNVYNREIPVEPLDIYVTSPPCFTSDTLVHTSMGYKPISEVVNGDKVLTHENRFKAVTSIGSKKSEISILQAQGILPTKSTANHKYYVREKSRKYRSNPRGYDRVFSEPKWVELKDLTKNHFIGIPIPKDNKNPRGLDKNTAYLLGRYVADGWYRVRDGVGSNITLSIGKDKLGDAKKIKFKHTLTELSRGCSNLIIYSNSLTKLVIDLGLGKGAINKRIPREIIELPNDILLSFFNGYMDGDGHKTKNSFRATSVSKELLMGLQLCVAKLFKANANIRKSKTPNKTIIEGREVNQRDYYVLEFRKEMKKQSNAVVIDDFIWYPVKSIEHTTRREDVYDITVEDDHSYTANNAVVHNCQAFSMAGKRLGKEEKRGILFYNSLEFINKNRPRYFIFENVKGLLSHDKKDKNNPIGRTFAEWINCLGGKSVNGRHTLFPYENSVPYHIYWQVLNAKDYGVPQNRERVFIIGIRDDKDNNFRFPKKIHLTKRLKDVLETEVDEKYYLSDTMVKGLMAHKERHEEKGTGFKWEPRNIEGVASCLRANGALAPTDNTIAVKSATKSGHELAKEGDSINLSNINSETRRGRVGNGVAQTLDTGCQQAVVIGAIRGRNPENTSDRTVGAPTQQMLEINDNGLSNTLTTVQKDNVVVVGNWIKGGLQENQPKRNDGVSPCLTSAMGMGGGHTPIHNYDFKIRKLTPTEAFRLMDFNEDFIDKVIGSGLISDTQLYKQAGNSIVVGVFAAILERLLHLDE